SNEGQEDVDETLAQLIAHRFDKLEVLNLVGVGGTLDLSLLKNLTTLKHLDVSMTNFWVWTAVPVMKNNLDVVDLIANNGSLVSLAARRRCFNPSHGEGNPEPGALGAAIEGTRLHSLELEECVFNDEQCVEIVEAIHRNVSLTHVGLPARGFTHAQRDGVKTALARNRMDERLGVAAGTALWVAFEDRNVPLEIAAKIADHALDGLDFKRYNPAARTMMSVSHDAHVEASAVYQALVHASRNPPVAKVD
ncbi:MAG TPA: hypothetical protein VH328_03695, partial [Burkholderiaceae bacterium]|nr:hypothetical protein [Burkholderiaceae bacterium]